MRKKRRQYTKEFKIEAVRLKVEEGRPIFEVAREQGGVDSRKNLHYPSRSQDGYF